MAGEIATAFVRIRPNMAGFQAETQSGVKKAFSGLAEAVGLAFGAAEVFHFGKDAVEGAANLQHQIENIRIEFGAASKAVVQFGHTGATALGISAELADSTSSRFGLLFKNLGIGNGTAAQMTLGLEKLAGSLAAIRGINPADVLSNLPLALTGNVRVLKSLGLAIDSTQIKFAAFKLGLISNVKQALTPAVKAEAVYALATAKLGPLQAQAAKHAGDLTNVQARLSAEWKNAKDALGGALLPEFAKLTRELTNWLDKMQRSGRLQRDFNEVGRITTTIIRNVGNAIGIGWRVWQTATTWVHGTRNALIGLFAILTVGKIRSIANSIVTNLVTNGLKKVGAATEEDAVKAKASFGTMGLAAKGFGLTIKSALIETGIGALAVAIGLITEYVITHWAYIRNYTLSIAKNMGAIWHGFAQEVIGEFEVLGGAIGTALTAPIVGFAELAAKAFGWVPFVGGQIKDAAKQVLAFSEAVGPGLVGKGLKNVQAGGQQITDTLYLSAAQALAKLGNDATIQQKLKDAGKGLGGKINDGVVTSLAGTPGKIGTAISTAMKEALAAAQQRIRAAIQSAKDNLDKIGGKLSDSVNKILDKLSPAGPAGAAQKAAAAKLEKLIASGAPGFAITRAAQELSSDLSNAGKMNSQDKAARHAAVKEQVANLTNEFNRGKINLSTFNQRLTALLKKDKVSYKIAGKELGSAFADGFQAQIVGLRQQAAAIAAVPAKLRGIGGGGGPADIRIIRPLEVIRRENQIIADKAAKQRERQIKAQERAAKAAEKVAQNTSTLKSTQVGKLPGNSAAHARANAKAGVQP